MRVVYFACLFSLCTLASADPIAPPRNVVAFAYGTSYGQCMGYCMQELRFSGDSVGFFAHGWYPEQTDHPMRGSIRMHKLEEVRSSLVLSGSETEELWRLVWSIKYTDLPERVGCPDCLDGGAEWLEFTTADHKTRRIEFEKNNAPTALKALSAWCSKTQARFKTPDDWRRHLPRPGSSR